MKIELFINGKHDPETIVENVSLGGIQISSAIMPKTKGALEAVLKLGTQEFTLNAHSVWGQALSGEDDSRYNYGFRLIFDKQDLYKRWLTFMKALHQYQSSQSKKA
ncbi:MAG: hypothetical protein ACJAT2_001783 [Bacteriovoracaceae bacterium]|jgi:hypothetical protein